MKKKILITLTVSLSLALAAVLTFTNTFSSKDKLLMENATAIAQEHPDRPPFNCPFTGQTVCWYDDGESLTEEWFEPEPITVYKLP